MKKAIKQISIEAQILIKELSQLNPDDFISYTDLSALIGRDVQAEGRSALTTARRVVLREHGLVFSPIINKGLHCMTEEEIAQSGIYGITKIKRIANREKKKLHLGIKNFDSLSNESKIKHNAAASIFGVFQIMASSKSTKKIETAVAASNDAIPSMRLLDIFKAT